MWSDIFLWRVLAARTRHLHLQVLCLRNGSCEMKLRLIEQACSCSTVRGRCGAKVRDRPNVWLESACR